MSKHNVANLGERGDRDDSADGRNGNRRIITSQFDLPELEWGGCISRFCACDNSL
jgi:hypothetical protein